MSDSTITVRVKDALGLFVTTGGDTIELFTDLGSLSSVTDNGDGTYTATLTCDEPGTATVTGTLNGSAISDTAVVEVTIGFPTVAWAPDTAYGGGAVVTPPASSWDPASEVVELHIGDVASDYRLQTVPGGSATGNLFGSDAAAIQSALEALSGIGAGNILVTGGPDDFVITFQGALANAALTQHIGLSFYNGGPASSPITTLGTEGGSRTPNGHYYLLFGAPGYDRMSASWPFWPVMEPPWTTDGSYLQDIDAYPGPSGTTSAYWLDIGTDPTVLLAEPWLYTAWIAEHHFTPGDDIGGGDGLVFMQPGNGHSYASEVFPGNLTGTDLPDFPTDGSSVADGDYVWYDLGPDWPADNNVPYP